MREIKDPITVEELKATIKNIDDKARKDKSDAVKLFADSRNPFEIGDIVEGNGNRIKIEKIQYYAGFSLEQTQCKFSGVELKKDGSPKLRQKGNVVFQSGAKLVK